jgi:hypothetical protein
MPIIPALTKWRQEDHEFVAGLNYIVRPYLKTPRAGDETQ